MRMVENGMVVKRQKLDSNRNVKIMCERESIKANSERERGRERYRRRSNKNVRMLGSRKSEI